MRGIGVAAERRANAVDFVCGDSGSDATTANNYSDLSSAILHGLAYLFSVVRIIVRNRAVMRAKVDQIVTRMTQLFNHPFIEWITSMICSNRYSHLKNLVILFYY